MIRDDPNSMGAPLEPDDRSAKILMETRAPYGIDKGLAMSRYLLSLFRRPCRRVTQMLEDIWRRAVEDMDARRALFVPMAGAFEPHGFSHCGGGGRRFLSGLQPGGVSRCRIAPGDGGF